MLGTLRCLIILNGYGLALDLPKPFPRKVWTEMLRHTALHPISRQVQGINIEKIKK